MRTILHVSDPHFGRSDPEIIGQFVQTCGLIRPDLVVISGDITQNANVEEFHEARAFLAALHDSGIKYFIIPGNHDIEPFHRPLERAFHHYERYQEYISYETEPRYLDSEIAIASIDTVRKTKLINGSISQHQVDRTTKWFASIDRAVVRIVVTHHPLDLPGGTMLPLAAHAERAVRGLASSRIDLFLAGHHHLSSVISTAERYRGLAAPSIAVQAGTVSKREFGERPSFNLLQISGDDIRIETLRVQEVDRGFRPVAVCRFARERGVWCCVERDEIPFAKTKRDIISSSLNYLAVGFMRY